MAGYGKIIVLVVFLASVAAPLHQFKVPPVMGQLIESMSLQNPGWLMSAFAVVGVVLAIPAGLIIRRLGLKAAGLIALFTLFAGSILGTLTSSSAVMLFSRVIEGTGMCLISVMAPAAIATWFPPEKRGLPMGIWASWVPMGSILAFNTAPLIGAWKVVWYVAAGYTAVVFVMMLVLFRMPHKEEAPPSAAASTTAGGNPYANGRIWLLALIFLLFNIMVLAVNSFMPAFLESERSFSNAKASSVSSIIMIVALVMGPIIGIVLNRIRSCKKIIVAGMFLAAILMAGSFSVSGAFIYLMMILIGVTFGMLPTATFSAAGEIMEKPELAGVGMSIVALGQNMGMCIGPVLFGGLIAGIGYEKAAYVLIPILVIGGICGLILKIR